jgi:hypothetical protein
MWWTKDPVRLQSEAADIEALAALNPWFTSVAKRVTHDLQFAIDFELLIEGASLPFTLMYPALFPATPPSVWPRDGRHYSGHQYGTGGELCLEHRADNWDPSITGAMMIESAYRLLSGERAGPGEIAAGVASAHETSLGQRLRGTLGRFLLTQELRAFAAALPTGTRFEGVVQDITGPNKTCTAFVSALEAQDDRSFRQPGIPTRSSDDNRGVMVRVPDVASIPPPDHAALNALAGISEDDAANDNHRSRFTVLADDRTANAYFSFRTDVGWLVIPYATIDLTGDVGDRLPPEYAALNGKKVGLVGCGSLGAKIAISLARAGVRAFVLVDDDILKPGNLVRHELDGTSLGAHKVDGVDARLRAIAPDMDITVRRILLGGQESAASTSTALDQLASCDLLIDATADPQAFNFVASAARAALRPMVFAEVYAGGIGGMVARTRPNIEPHPYAARREYLAWCHAQGVPWEGFDADYNTIKKGLPVIADDADVGVIAAHAARMALDTLLRPTASSFPHPAYVIGLKVAWIFTEPFDTRPVDFSTNDQWALPVSEGDAASAMAYVISLLEPQGRDASRTGT